MGYRYSKHRLRQLGTAAGPGDRGVLAFSTSGGKGEVLHHTSDLHFNRRNWLFFQNFPHIFAVICQGLSCHVSGIQRDAGSFSLPCLRQHPDPQCHPVALPNGFCWSLVQRPNPLQWCCWPRAWATPGLSFLTQPRPHRWQVGLGCLRRFLGCLHQGQGRAAAAPTRASAGLRHPGVPRLRCGVQPPIPVLPRGPAGPRLLRSWEEKSMNMVQSKQIVAEPAPS